MIFLKYFHVWAQAFWSISESCYRERERNLLFVQQMSQIWYVTQYEVVGEGKCFFFK